MIKGYGHNNRCGNGMGLCGVIVCFQCVLLGGVVRSPAAENCNPED